MKFRYLLFWALLLLQCFTLAWASVREVPLDELQPTRAQRQSTLIILKVINEYHYKKHLLDDEMSRAILVGIWKYWTRTRVSSPRGI